ncbi:MAG: PAS domain S-box protein [Acidobacteria bacterium]|nr:PAS domain S-box protein [Acidobacteriota bacterium]
MKLDAARVRPLRLLWTCFLLAVVYFLGAKMGLALAFSHPSATPVWPPTGIALAAFLVLGYRVWPGIIAAAFLANVTTAGSVATSIGIAIGNTAEGLVGAYLVNRFAGGVHAFDRVESVFRFVVLAAIFSTMVSATVGVTTLSAGGFADWADYGSIWLTWWLGDAVGALIVAPVLVLWFVGPRPHWTPRKLLEATALGLWLLLVGWIVFEVSGPAGALKFFCIPFLLWAAFRFGKFEAAVTVLLLSGIAIWNTLQSHTFLTAPEARNELLLTLQAFIGVAGAMTLAVATVISEWKQTEEMLRRARDDLEGKVETTGLALAGAEEQIRLSEALLSRAEQIAHTGCFRWNSAKNQVTWSEELYRIYGRTRAQFSGTLEAFLSCVHPDDVAAVRSIVERAVRERQPFRIRERIVRPDGEIRVLDSSGEVVVDAAGQVVDLFGVCRDVTDEQRIREEEAKLASIVENSPNFIAIAGLDRKMLFVNPAGRALVGLESDEEVPGTALLDYFPEEDREKIGNEYLPLLVEHGRFNIETRLKHKTGVPIPVLWTAFVIADPETGAPVFLSCIAHDIRQRKEAEEKFQALLESAPDALVIVDNGGKICIVNSQTEKLFGYTREELIGRTLEMLIPERLRARHPLHRAGYLLNPKRRPMGEGLELYGLHKDGHEVPVDVALSPLHAESGLLVTAAIRDITQRKQAEEVMRDSEERFRLLADGVKDYATFMLDAAGRVISWNTSAERMKGYKAGEILGRHFSCFYMSEEIEAGRPEALLARAAAKGSAREEGWRLRKDGSRFLADVVVTALRDKDGNLRSFAKVCRDVTERKEIEGALRRLSGRLLRLQDEERRRMARELHDTTGQTLAALAVNLSIVSGSVSGLDQRGSAALSESVELVDQCAREIRTLSYLLHPPMLDELGLASALRWYGQGFAKRSGVQVSLDIPSGFVRLPQEAEVALFRIVQESLSNVHRHSGSPAVEMRLAVDSNCAVLEVKDHGRGITPGALEESDGRGPVLGVGITGMRERMRQLGGWLEIHSDPGGTTVRATLPLEK